MNYAEEIKQTVDMKAVAELYGIRADRAGFARCPFHKEKTASFKIYEGDRGYHCFGCGRSGDVISFVREMDGCTFPEACEKLNRAFSLGLPIGERQPRRKELGAAQRAFMLRKQREAAQSALEGAEAAFWSAYDAWLINQSAIEKNAPKSELEPFSAEYAEAVAKEPLLEYELEKAEEKYYILSKNH